MILKKATDLLYIMFMAEQSDLIEASKLFKDVAQKSMEDNLAFGVGAVYGTATEFKNSQTPDKVRLQGEYKKTLGQVFNEFLEATKAGEIAVVGDQGILDQIGSGDVAALGLSIEYQKKDLPVVIVNRHFKTLTDMPNGLVNVSDVIEAISDAVFQKNIPEDKRINSKQVPESCFNEYAITLPL